MQMKNNKWLGLLGISLASFLGCIDFTIVNTALPNIQADLHASVTQLQWIINIFLLVLTALMVVKGRLADIYGRRKMLYIGMLIFGFSSLGAGLSPSIQWLILFRFVQGIGVAILYTVPVAIITSLFPAQERARATGILFGVNGFGLAIGPVVGGFIISALSWRWVFFVNLPIILLSFIICLPVITESKSHEGGKKIDWLGFLLLATSLPMLILATVQGSSWGWGSIPVISLYGFAVIALILFYFVEQRSNSPILQLKLFANRLFVSSALANFLLAFYTVAFFILPLFLHDILGQSSYQIGLTLLPATMLVALLSPLVGHSVEKYGVKGNLLFGFIMFAISAYLQTHFTVNSSMTFIITALILLGIGWAFILSPTFVAAVGSLPDSMGGVAMGTLGTVHNFGGAVGLALGTLLYHYHASIVLLAASIKQNLVPGPWFESAIANPERATQIISQATHLSMDKSKLLFIDYFNSTFASLMWLLFTVSVLGFLIVLFGLKAKKQRK